MTRAHALFIACTTVSGGLLAIGGLLVPDARIVCWTVALADIAAGLVAYRLWVRP